MKTKQTRTAAIGGIILGVVLGIMSHHFLVAKAGNLEPTDPPGPTMKTLDEVEPRIPIPGSSSPAASFTIGQSGSYYLTGDRYASGHGIVVAADNVTIDLMGYSLIGPGSGANYGIYIIMNDRHNVEIRNGTVRDFGSHGIYQPSSANAKDHRVIGVRAVSNGSGGIYLAGISHLVKDCTAAENGGYGIYASIGSTVTGNTAYNNPSYGIYADGGSTVTGNTAYGNQGRGIYAGSGCTVTGNTAYNNQTTGITLGPGCTVTGNTARWNQFYGIYLTGNSLVDQNTAYSNNQSGGAYVNMNNPGNCTFGVNHAP